MSSTTPNTPGSSPRIHRTGLVTAAALVTSLSLSAQGHEASESARAASDANLPNAQMQAVLDQHAKLGPLPLESLSPAQARLQPSPADAVKALLQSQGKSTTPESVGDVEDRSFAGPGGDVPIRVYTPTGEGPFPMVLYVHGGGWVIATLDTYDASPRALANAAHAVIVSTHYRQAPEHPFPAAHEDVLAAYQWMLQNADSLNGDARRVAVVGESAGGNLALNVALTARDRGWTAPVHQVLVYPVAGNDMDTPSYQEHAAAKPLNKATMQWFVKHTFAESNQASDPRIALYARTDLAGVAPATILTAQIDPLRSDGERLAAAMKSADVPVTLVNYPQVTHEFFGMAAVLDDAKQAQQTAGRALREAFARPRSNN